MYVVFSFMYSRLTFNPSDINFINLDSVRWVFSTLAQVFGALIGLLGIVIIYALDKINDLKEKIEDIRLKNELIFEKLEVRSMEITNDYRSFRNLIQLANIFLGSTRKNVVNSFIISSIMLIGAVLILIFFLNFCYIASYGHLYKYSLFTSVIISAMGMLSVFVFILYLKDLAETQKNYELTLHAHNEFVKKIEMGENKRI